MADTTNYKWRFDLVEYALTTGNGNDYTAGIQSTGSLTLSDIAASIAAERTDLRQETIEMVLKIWNAKVMEQVCMGNTVNTGLVLCQPVITGTFTGNTGIIDTAKNLKKVSVQPVAAFRSQLDDVELVFTGYVKDIGGARIRNVTDSETESSSGVITPGGNLVISGTKIKCVASDGKSTGVARFINTETGAITEVTKFTVNKPSQLIVIIPSTLTNGTYTFQIETYYSTSGALKTVRTITYGKSLTVGTVSSSETTDETEDTTSSEE